jgi:hypothetical protein
MQERRNIRPVKLARRRLLLSKRQKTKESALPEGSFLLETQPEIVRREYSFLMLKEALILRQMHRQFNNTSNDLY